MINIFTSFDVAFNLIVNLLGFSVKKVPYYYNPSTIGIMNNNI